MIEQIKSHFRRLDIDLWVEPDDKEVRVTDYVTNGVYVGSELLSILEKLDYCDTNQEMIWEQIKPALL